MGAYYIVTIASLFFAQAASMCDKKFARPRTKQNTITRFFLGAAILVLAVSAGLRYYVGTDFGAYYKGLTIYGGRLRDAVRSLDEPGLPILATIVGWFTEDGAYFVLLCSVLTISLMLIPALKYTDYYVFAVCLFIFTGNWHGTFNGVRQYLAAAIIFAGHRLIIDRKFVKYAIVVFLAFLVHRSAIIMIVPYFILCNRITFKNILLLILGTLVISANYDTIFSFVGLLKDSEINMGDQGYYSTSVNIFRVLVSCAPAIFVLAMYAGKPLSIQQTFCINALIINAAAMIATSNSAYLARLGLYTNVFTPLALSKLIVFKNRTLETIVKIAIVCLYAVFWYIEISQSSSLKPFCWVWERTAL